MRLHFAVSPGTQHLRVLQSCDVENILISYAFIQNPRRWLDLLGDYVPKNMIIDSGAFSVWSRGESINIDAYKQFCVDVKRILPSETHLYFVNLDVLPGKMGVRPTEEQVEDSAQRSWNNMLKLEDAGLKVINVYHQHEDLKWLDKLREHSDYIGISPANDVSMPEKLNWLKHVFGMIRNTIRTHGFAVTSHQQLYQFPFFSVDSSSWVTPARYGRIPIFRDDLTIGTVEYKDKQQIMNNWDYLSHLGIEKIGADNWKDRVMLSIKSYQQLQKVATKLWSDRGITWKENEL